MASLSEQPVLSDVSQALAESKVPNDHVAEQGQPSQLLPKSDLQSASDKLKEDFNRLSAMSPEEAQKRLAESAAARVFKEDGYTGSSKSEGSR